MIMGSIDKAAMHPMEIPSCLHATVSCSAKEDSKQQLK